MKVHFNHVLVPSGGGFTTEASMDGPSVSPPCNRARINAFSSSEGRRWIWQDRRTLRRPVGKTNAVPEIECSPNQLNQVFMNILVNAAHAIERTGRVTITTRYERGFVTVSFRDTGRGIDPKALPNIFDPGFTTKGMGVGTGLGLAICYRIVKDHNGTIDVRSEPGDGTIFIVSLPSRAAPIE